jgi:uncharacterized protein (TIGR01777 family)
MAERGMATLQLVRRRAGRADEVEWNPARTPAVADTQWLEGVRAAIHLSGANVAGHRWTAEYKEEMTASRVGSTRALAETLARLRNPPQGLLVASATGIYGNRGDELLDEDSAAGEGFLAELCQQWEAAAQPAKDAGIRVVHLRFGVVVGPPSPRHPGALDKMVPLFRWGMGGALGSGKQWMSWISLKDAVAGVLFALEDTGLTGALNLTAPHPVTNGEFTRALARQVHRPAVFAAPAFALRLAMGEMADEALLAGARVVPGKLMAAGFEFALPTIESALAAALKPA